MKPLPADDNANLTDKPPHVERLSIALLMLWTATSAALLGIDRQFNLWGGGRTNMGALPQVLAFCYAPLYGATMAAVLLMVSRWFTRGPRFPGQPGHWLLVLAGCNTIAILGVKILLFSMTDLDKLEPYFRYLWPSLAIRATSGLMSLIVSFVATYYCQGPWRWVFRISIISGLITLLVVLSWFFTPELVIRTPIDAYAYYFVSFTVLVAAILDWRRTDVQRDDLHWVGVAVRIALTLITIAVPFLAPLFRQTP